MSKERI